MFDFGDIWEVLQVLAHTGGITGIHAEDNDIVMHMYEKLTREDRTGLENVGEVRNRQTSMARQFPQVGRSRRMSKEKSSEPRLRYGLEQCMMLG
jgi:hypothetical protein